MSSKVPSTLEHFSRLNQSVWYHAPTLSPSSSTSSPPDLILLCGWMDATPRHISKYTSTYTTLYPTSPILFINTSSIDAAFRTYSANHARIKPILDILLALPAESKVLVHLFSNGGGWTTCLIAKQYHKRTGRALPVSAMVLDSSPGKATYHATVQAFAVILPKNRILNALGILVLQMFYWMYMFAYFVGRKLDLPAQSRVDLNDERYFGKEAGRFYVYSKGDTMVDWKFVEEHVEGARSKGYKVVGERWGDSKHCGHMVVDPERYWKGVKELWARVEG